MPLTSNISINNLQLTIDSLEEDFFIRKPYPYSHPSSNRNMLIGQSKDEIRSRTCGTHAWCRGEDLNLHSFWELAPKASVSAIPPPRLERRHYNGK